MTYEQVLEASKKAEQFDKMIDFLKSDKKLSAQRRQELIDHLENNRPGFDSAPEKAVIERQDLKAVTAFLHQLYSEVFERKSNG